MERKCATGGCAVLQKVLGFNRTLVRDAQWMRASSFLFEPKTLLQSLFSTSVWSCFYSHRLEVNSSPHHGLQSVRSAEPTGSTLAGLTLSPFVTKPLPGKLDKYAIIGATQEILIMSLSATHVFLLTTSSHDHLSVTSYPAFNPKGSSPRGCAFDTYG